MGKPISMLTDVNIANVFELLLLKMNDLQASVDMLTPINPYQLFNGKQTATILNISTRTLITLRNNGKIDFLNIESRILYSFEDIREFVKKCRQSKADLIK